MVLMGAVSPLVAQSTGPDLLTFARGAMPIAIEGGDAYRVDMTHAVRMVDGHPGGFVFASRTEADTEVGIVFALPAPTRFTDFEIPNVLETPSPSQTFFQDVVIEGSPAGPTGPWMALAAAELETHGAAGEVTRVASDPEVSVGWIRVRLRGGIEVTDGPMFFEFSEIVGRGSQESPALETGLGGSWRGRGVALTLQQTGPSVVGCYDRGSPLTGTVTGTLLTAIGIGADDGVVSHFIVGRTEDGLRGLRSTNGAPFRLFEGTRDDGRPVECPETDPPDVGCGAVLHGVRFAFDSADLLPESDSTLDRLADAFRDALSAVVTIEGHTSSEGDEAYNMGLSDRRAASVVEALIERGVARDRLRSAGRGETSPIASNDVEAGRAMNRRVEVRCTDG